MKLLQASFLLVCQCGNLLKVRMPADSTQKTPSLAQMEYSCNACPNKFFVHIQESKGHEQKPKEKA